MVNIQRAELNMMELKREELDRAEFKRAWSKRAGFSIMCFRSVCVLTLVFFQFCPQSQFSLQPHRGRCPERRAALYLCSSVVTVAL